MATTYALKAHLEKHRTSDWVMEHFEKLLPHFADEDRKVAIQALNESMGHPQAPHEVKPRGPRKKKDGASPPADPHAAAAAATRAAGKK